MTLYRTFSKMQIARIFSVSRSTVYDWESRGLPVLQAGRHGRPAKLDFEAVLQWYLDEEEMKGVPEKGLEILEGAVRKRKEQHYG